MIISYNWLLDYLPEAVPVQELSDILTSIGLEVEALETVEAVKGGLEGLVIGEVLTCEKHPNADKLKLTTVKVGKEEPLNIVCGAHNVAAGQKVVVATVGTTIHPVNGEPFQIKKAKIRGEASEGMICAEDEIGLSEDHAGIIILPDAAVPGTLAKDYYNIPAPDTAIHIGLTPNRSDAMSHIGVARDVCAYLTYHKGKEYKVRMPDTTIPAPGADKLDIAVHIKNAEACPRYMGISITGIKVGPSPDWLKQRLQAIDVRSINNIVDITNYILHEWGQPLHAFDADKIGGRTVNVQMLPKDSKFVTLDEKERKLNDNDLMICDNKEGMCIAGVFGGMHSGVTDDTTSVFLESAYFHPTYIRRTSLHHGLRTDAATHFEKGVDMNNLEPALKRAAALMVELAGGSLASEIVDVYERKLEQRTVDVTYAYVKKLSGKEYDHDSIKKLLVSLGFIVEKEDDKGFTVVVPTNKTDVFQAADIVEEILRIDGLDNIPIPGKLNITLNSPMANDRHLRNKIAGVLCGLGFREILTNSIVNSKYYPEREDLVRMLNSLSSELDVMRPSMLESGLEVIQYNCNRKNTDLLLFDFGKIYSGKVGAYNEQHQLALYVTGNTETAHWNRTARQADIYYLKGIVQMILTQAGISKTVTEHKDDSAVIKWKNEVLCDIFKVDAKKLSDFDIKQPVYYAVFNWDLFVKANSNVKVTYKEVPKYPAVQRDLAIVLDKAVQYSRVQEVTDKLKIDSLQSYGLFDVFESDKLGAGKKSFALSYTFQLNDRTLTDKETDALMQKLMKAYKDSLQAQIRE